MDKRKTTETVRRVASPSPFESRAASSSDRHYVLLFHGDSSSMYPIAPSGELVIGRGEKVDIAVDDDTAVSRRHARIALNRGEARLSDLGSHNGTRVNGDLVTGTRLLSSGDVISIGNATLVYHASVRSHVVRPTLEFAEWRRRAEEEIDRSARFQRPVSIVAVHLGDAPPDRALVTAALAGLVRLIDVVGWGGADHLLILLPETRADEADEVAQRVLGAIRPITPETRAGIAAGPSDGSDVDTLVSSARAAQLAAKPGEVSSASRAFRALELAGNKVIVADPAMARLYALIERLANVDLPVLVCGETGTGKELAASALHHWSKRRGEPLVTVNSAALPENLVESELFGHERGAFSGAVASKAGLLEAASGGTVFLDEIGELSPAVQAKLLRAIETKRVMRVGDVRERAIDIRIVAATNRNLEEEIKNGRFRRDLYFRLSGATIWIPPLRDRQRELPLLAAAFLDDACARAGREPLGISDATMRALAAHAWPGNVRELKNVMEYAAATVHEAAVEPWHLEDRLGPAAEPDEPDRADPKQAFPSPPPVPTFRPIDEEIQELERGRMMAALEAVGGNQTRAAALISMPLRTFVAKLKHYQLTKRR